MGVGVGVGVSVDMHTCVCACVCVHPCLQCMCMHALSVRSLFAILKTLTVAVLLVGCLWLQSLVETDVLTNEELDSCIASDFNPIRVGFKGGPEVGMWGWVCI